MIFACCSEERRHELRAHAMLNGVDFLEVLDREAPVPLARQRTLLVRLMKPVPPVAQLSVANLFVEGGERITDLQVLWANAAANVSSQQAPNIIERNFYHDLPNADRVLVVRTDRAGDFSPYRLRIGVDRDNRQPLPGFDPMASVVTFSFKVECPADLDCAPQRECAAPAVDSPDINYLAKDYQSFRRLMLDRLAVLLPDWRERSAADLGITLVELLAYTADRLSYWQDAIATEAYIGTARRRVSVRRHARLVDYRMNEGCNARTWVHFDVGANPVTLQSGTAVVTRIPSAGPSIVPTAAGDIPESVLLQRPTVFLTAKQLICRQSHNEMKFYTWSEQRCCLPQGATRATLVGSHPYLREDDILIFVEHRGPATGAVADANLEHRHAVRLVEVVAVGGDGQPLRDPLTQQLITEIRWDDADALPIAFTASMDDGAQQFDDVTVALGNIVLADHGRWVRGEDLGRVEEPALERFETVGAAPCATRRRASAPLRYRPTLTLGDLTHRVDPYPLDARPRPASRMLDSDPRAAEPAIELDSSEGSWEARADLLGSKRIDPHFVVEIDERAIARLRFGEGEHGRRPLVDTQFTAHYRTGNGASGNIGADTLKHIVTGEQGIIGVGNPLPARGGVDPETADDVRTRAPYAFRRQERAVSADDYAEITLRKAGVQRAAGSFRWTGSWHTAFVTVDRLGGAATDERFSRELEQFLDRFRMAGVDAAVDAPRFVSLELDMFVCVKPEHFRAHVREALLRRFSNRTVAGRRGFFHADNFTFGQSVWLSAIYDAAHAAPGVESVRITRFRRQGTRDTRALRDGRIDLGRLEIARLDNDPNYPEHGVLRLQMGGGK